MEERAKYLAQINDYTQEKYSLFNNMFSLLGWNEKDFKFSTFGTSRCPVDPGHFMPNEKLAEHVENCSLRNEGYAPDEILLPPSSADEKYSVELDVETRKKVLTAAIAINPTLKLGVENILEDTRPVPKTVDRYLSTFTVDERRIFYEHAVSLTSENKQKELLCENMISTDGQPSKKPSKTIEEMMIAMRDAKRRRASYKGKKVKGSSYTETLKNLIESQMDSLEEMQGGVDKYESSKNSETPKKAESKICTTAPLAKRPRQLYEKQYMSIDRWTDIGDWTRRFDKSSKKREMDQKNMEKYKSKSYIPKEGGFEVYIESLKDSNDYVRDDRRKESSSNYHRRKLPSPSSKRQEDSDSYWSRSTSSSKKESRSNSRDKLDSEKETHSADSSRKSSLAIHSPSSSFGRSADSKECSSKSKKSSKSEKRKHRSRSNSPSRHHKKHRKEKRRKKDDSDPSRLEVNDNRNDTYSLDSSSDHHHSSHKKKKKRSKDEH